MIPLWEGFNYPGFKLWNWRAQQNLKYFFLLPSSYSLIHVLLWAGGNSISCAVHVDLHHGCGLHPLYGWTLVEWHHQLASCMCSSSRLFWRHLYCQRANLFRLCIPFTQWKWLPQLGYSRWRSKQIHFHDWKSPILIATVLKHPGVQLNWTLVSWKSKLPSHWYPC